MSTTSSARSPACTAICQAVRNQYSWVSMQALGKPVVPEVYCRLASARTGHPAAPAGVRAKVLSVCTGTAAPRSASTERTRSSSRSEVSTAVLPESASTWARSALRHRMSTGTATAPARSTASHSSGQQARFAAMIATRSPGPNPAARSPSASSRVRCPASPKLTLRSGQRRNSRSPCRRAASASRELRSVHGGPPGASSVSNRTAELVLIRFIRPPRSSRSPLCPNANSAPSTRAPANLKAREWLENDQ